MILETQLIKSIYHPEHVVEIKEEVFELDRSTLQILRYCVIVERARQSLYDLYSSKILADGTTKPTGLWFDKDFRETYLESFSMAKFFFYFYQSMRALDYLHSKGILYCDMKP